MRDYDNICLTVIISGIFAVILFAIWCGYSYECQKLAILQNTKNNIQVKSDENGVWVLIQPIYNKAEQELK
jgi:hypothetical protein